MQSPPNPLAGTSRLRQPLSSKSPGAQQAGFPIVAAANLTLDQHDIATILRRK
jgi:hypothetical protein